MRTTRKLLALLLAVAMVFTMTAITALATGGDDGTTTPDNGTTMPGGDPTPDGTPTTPDDGTTTPDNGTTMPGGDPTPDGTPTTPGDPATPEVSAEAKAVIALIEALPTSEEIQEAMTAGPFEVEAYKVQVSEARVAYEALSAADKASVGDISRLNQAEETLAQLESISLLGTGTVCEIEGGDQYQTLQAAVEAVQEGQTITMLENVTLTAAVTLPNGVTLDLNGKTISGSTTNIISIAEEADVTITDNSNDRGGKISSSTTSSLRSGAVAVEDGATLTLDGGVTLETTERLPPSLFIIKNPPLR